MIQQRAGVSIAGNVGAASDRYERCDAVADRVVQGQSADALLNEMTASPSYTSTVHDPVVQRSDDNSSLPEAVKQVVASAVEYVVDATVEVIGGDTSSADHTEASDTAEITEETSEAGKASAESGAAKEGQSAHDGLSTRNRALAQWIHPSHDESDR